MKSFIKDHMDFIAIYLLTLLLIITVAGMDLFLQEHTVSFSSLVYMSIIGIVGLIMFLLYRYYKQMQNYRIAQSDWYLLGDALDPFHESNELFKLFNLRMKNIYDLHTEATGINDLDRQQYYTFIQQWVHQMKTPLSVIQLQLQHAEIADMEQEFLVSLQEEADKMKDGLEMVLYSARLEAFERDLKIEQIEISEFTRNIVNMYKKSFINAHVFPEFNIDQAMINTDRKWLVFVMGQLISNAIKYSNNIGNKISFQTKIEGDKLLLSIQDYGVGIPKQDIRRLFDPFFTGSNGRNHQESTGMGLYLCKQVCDRLGHQIKAESMVNEGTTMTITFTNVTKL